MFSKSPIQSFFSSMLLGLALTSTAAFAGNHDDSKAFLKTVAQGGMAEVEYSRLALKMASNADIQDFAKHMIEDHTAANDRVMALAKDRRVELDKDLSMKHKAIHKKLSKKNDRDRAFDRAYIDQMIQDHKKTIK